MKLILDEKTCLKHKLTWEEFLVSYIWSHVTDPSEIIDNLVNREVLVEQNGKYMVTQHWADVMDEILCDSIKTNDRTDEELSTLAQKMREVYPKGKQPGSSYYYRCNNREVVLKLKKFFITYGQYSDEEIIKAVRKFVASLRGNYTYLPLIKYFISKNKPITNEDGVTHNVEYSLLADYLENMDDNEIELDFNYTEGIIKPRN